MNKIIYSLFFITILVVIDQWSKFFVFSYLKDLSYYQVEIFPFFNLVSVRNYGVSFGMLSDIANAAVVLSILSAIIIVILFIWLLKERNLVTIISLNLIIGGALGNLIDRIIVGSVADFLDFHVAGYHWPAFNMADAFIFVGTFLILFEQIFFNKEGKKNVKTK